MCPSLKRFLLIVSPRGDLSCVRPGSQLLLDYYREWVVLLKINRPLCPRLAGEAKQWALDVYGPAV